MITEDYVSFEIAKLLKEKGFDCHCEVWYSEYTSQFGGEKYTSIEFDDHNRFEENYKFICSAPTLQMATKWLRKVHNLHIMVDCIGAENYMPTIQFTYNSKDIVIKSKTSKIGGNGFDSHEQAVDAAIKYCLENLI